MPHWKYSFRINPDAAKIQELSQEDLNKILDLVKSGLMKDGDLFKYQTVEATPFSPPKYEAIQITAEGIEEVLKNLKGFPVRYNSQGVDSKPITYQPKKQEPNPFSEEDPTMRKRAYILGHSATSVIKWMGKNNWPLSKATAVVNELATGRVSKSTISTGLNDGRHPRWSEGTAELSIAEIQTLEEAAQGIRSEDDRMDFEPKNTSKEEKDSAEYDALIARIDILAERIEEVAENQPKRVHITIETEKQKVELNEYIHPVFEEVMFHIGCGDNVMLVGPKGCGKTTLAEQVGKALAREHSAISLSGGVTEAKLFGRVTPNLTNGKNEYHQTPFVEACEKGHVFLLDEVDAGDPNVLLSLNMVLANRKLILDRPKNPIVKVHKDFICIAAANTWGNGADRHYVGRNQLDGAFGERFVAIEMDYDRNLELSLCPDHPQLVKRLHDYRTRCNQNRLERSISTRFILRAYNWMLHGKDMDFVDKRLFGGWRADEIRKVRGF